MLDARSPVLAVLRRCGTLSALVFALGACGGSGDGGAPAPAPAADGTVGTDTDPGAIDAANVPGAVGIDLVNGHVNTAFREYDAAGALTYESRTLIEAERSVLRSREQDYGDPGPLGLGYVYRTENRYDARGDLVSSAFTVDDGLDEGDPTTTLYEHDGLGRLVRRTSVGAARDGSDIVAAFDWDGTRLLSRSERPGEPGGFLVEYGYDGGGDAPSSSTVRRWYRGDPGLGEPEAVPDVTRRTYERDPDGRLLRVVDDREDGEDIVLEYGYDGAGNVAIVTELDATGAVRRTTEHDWTVTEERIYNRWLRIFRFFP